MAGRKKRGTKPENDANRPVEETRSVEELRMLKPAELKSLITKERQSALESLQAQAAQTGGSRPSRLKPGWTNATAGLYQTALDLIQASSRSRKKSVKDGQAEVLDTPGDAKSQGRDANTGTTRQVNHEHAGSEMGSDERHENVAGIGIGSVEESHEPRGVTGNNPASGDDDNAGERRPGPLTGDQLRQCADMAERWQQWIQLKAAEWNVSETSVAFALGLHDMERRKTSLWNKHQIRFYSQARNDEETLDEHRARCSRDYAYHMGENRVLTDEEKVAREAWKAGLEEWYLQFEKDQITQTIVHGQRYRVMMSLRDELTEKAVQMSTRWEIEMFGMVVTRSPDDNLARAASFIFSGNDKTRKWLSTGNVPVGSVLADFETMARGEELKSRESAGMFNLPTFRAINLSRDERNKAVRKRLASSLTAAMPKNFARFPWQDLGRVLIEEKFVLLGWPHGVPFPGGPKPIEAVDTEGFKSICRALDEPDVGTQAEVLRFEPWSEAQTLDEDDDEYPETTLIVSDKDVVLLRIKEVEKFKADCAKDLATRKAKGAKAAAARAQIYKVSDDSEEVDNAVDDNEGMNRNAGNDGLKRSGRQMQGSGSSPDEFKQRAINPSKRAKIAKHRVGHRQRNAVSARKKARAISAEFVESDDGGDEMDFNPDNALNLRGQQPEKDNEPAPEPLASRVKPKPIPTYMGETMSLEDRSMPNTAVELANALNPHDARTGQTQIELANALNPHDAHTGQAPMQVRPWKAGNVGPGWDELLGRKINGGGCQGSLSPILSLEAPAAQVDCPPSRGTPVLDNAPVPQRMMNSIQDAPLNVDLPPFPETTIAGPMLSIAPDVSLNQNSGAKSANPAQHLCPATATPAVSIAGSTSEYAAPEGGWQFDLQLPNDHVPMDTYAHVDSSHFPVSTDQVRADDDAAIDLNETWEALLQTAMFPMDM